VSLLCPPRSQSGRMASLVTNGHGCTFRGTSWGEWPFLRKAPYCILSEGHSVASVPIGYRGSSRDGWPFSRKASPVVHGQMASQSKASPVVSFAASVGTDGLSFGSALGCILLDLNWNGWPFTRECPRWYFQRSRDLLRCSSRDGWPFSRKASPCCVSSDGLSIESVSIALVASVRTDGLSVGKRPLLYTIGWSFDRKRPLLYLSRPQSGRMAFQ
jgi:hypothetical protein